MAASEARYKKFSGKGKLRKTGLTLHKGGKGDTKQEEDDKFGSLTRNQAT